MFEPCPKRNCQFAKLPKFSSSMPSEFTGSLDLPADTLNFYCSAFMCCVYLQ